MALFESYERRDKQILASSLSTESTRSKKQQKSPRPLASTYTKWSRAFSPSASRTQNGLTP